MISKYFLLDSNYDRFISEILKSERVWYLATKQGFATCEAKDPEDIVLVFFSDEKYALKIQSTYFSEFEVLSVSLYGFLIVWLDGFAERNNLSIAVNRTKNKAGKQILPLSLKIMIEDKIEPDILKGYLEKRNKMNGYGGY